MRSIILVVVSFAFTGHARRMQAPSSGGEYVSQEMIALGRQLFALSPTVNRNRGPLAAHAMVSNNVGMLSRPCRLPHRAAAPSQCAHDEDEGGGWGGLFDVVLVDPETGLEIACKLLESTSVESNLYASMIPQDIPAVIAQVRGGELVDIDEEDKLAKLFPAAAAVCQENDMELVNSAVTFTLNADLERLDELAANSELEVADGDDGDAVEVVATFVFDGEEYYVMRLTTPLILMGKQTGATSFVIPSDDEMDKVAPILESAMEQSTMDLENAMGQTTMDSSEYSA